MSSSPSPLSSSILLSPPLTSITGSITSSSVPSSPVSSMTTPPRLVPKSTHNTPAKGSGGGGMAFGNGGSIESLRMMPNSEPGRLGNAHFESLPNGTYLSQSKIQIYLTSALSTLLKLASTQPPPPTISNSNSNSNSNQSGGLQIPQPNSVHSRPLRFLSTYFQNLTSPSKSHTTQKPFTYIVSTPYNRQTFLQTFTHLTSNFHSLQLTADDFHNILLLLCPDFARSLTHTCAWLCNGGRASASVNLVDFMKLSRTFKVFFSYVDFFLQVLTFFLAAYDGASSPSPQSIVMPPLLCSNDTSPLKELSTVYTSSSWRRAFGCSVDSSHVLTALTRIEKGCGEAGLPSCPGVAWRKGIENKGKVTLERFWNGVESCSIFNEC